MRKKRNFFIRCAIKYGLLLVIVAILSVFFGYALVEGNATISNVIDEMLLGKDVKVEEFLMKFLAFTLLGALAGFFQRMFASKFAILVCTDYKDVIAGKLYHIEYKYFDATNSAILLNKVIGDFSEITSFLENVLPEILGCIISLVVYSVYIGKINLGLLVLILISYPIVFFIASILVKKISKLQKVYRQKTDTITQIAQDVVSGILVLRSFTVEDVFRNKMHKATIELVENEEKRTKISNTAIVIRKVIQWLPNIISAIYAVYLVSNSKISLGGLVGFILILNKFVDAFIGLPFCIVDALAGIVSIKRIEEILSVKEETTGDNVLPLDESMAISFEKVDFGYTDNLVLKDLSFEVKKGESVAFVGESGGGKSTILNLICGFYSKQKGKYKLFGVDIEDWNISALRNQIALVSQNVFLFPTTIQENIAFGRKGATFDEVIEACKQAKIHDFIMSLPQGYQTMVGERGAILSGGQRQRISIARAILKGAPILLLDEPTSALDVETESDIQDAINVLMKDRTCITIAHRLSTIVNADNIMFLKQGKVIESGTHKELIMLNGEYAKMYGEGVTYGEI